MAAVASRLSGRDASRRSPSSAAVFDSLQAGAQLLLGRDSATVTVTVISDYECPACRTAYLALKALVDSLDGGLAVAYQHYPLAQHPRAATAAMAVLCAGREHRAPALHDLIFMEPGLLAEGDWSDLGRRIAIDSLTAFVTCVRDGGELARLRREMTLADRLGIRLTPTILIGDRVVEGWESRTTVALIDSLLRRPPA